jgi:Fe-S-cluster containining protein
MSSTDVFALSIHADYRCRHSGACCSADWDVPVELPIYRRLEGALAAGTLRPHAAARHLTPLLTGPDLPEDAAAMLERTDTGACVFLESGSRLCIVHRDLGDAALPATCRHFPRLAVRDGRGTFITLSHFCPTAASMLFRDRCPLAIVRAPGAFPPADYEGLVVSRDDLPPLLTPAMLMDETGYSAWERHMVSRCAHAERSPESVVATLWRDALTLRGWRPGGVTLADAVAQLPPAFVHGALPASLEASLELHQGVRGAMPDDLRPAADEDGLEAAYAAGVKPAWRRFSEPLNRYLAAKAFASWAAYQGRGVSTIIRGLEAALAVVRVEAARRSRDAGRPLDATLLLEAVRAADFALNHLAVGEDLARAWSSAEA